MTARKVTGADVARAAGVSRATVSYVLNDTPGQTIPEQTRRRVLSAAKRLGYVPHMAGRMLRTGRSDLIVWILPDWPIGTVLGSMIEALSREASRRRFTLAVVQEGVEAARLESTLRALAPAAISALHELPRNVLDFAKAAGIPVADFGRDDSPAFRRDGLTGFRQHLGAMQVRYLADKGHRHIAYLYPDEPRVAEFANDRYEGARSAARQLGLPALRKRTTSLDRRRLATLAREWSTSGVTAVCAYNDEWAMGLLSGMALAGLQAPGDLAVIGLDNAPTAPVATPPLTTIDQDIATYAVDVLDRIERALGLEPAARDAQDVRHPHVVQRESA